MKYSYLLFLFYLVSGTAYTANNDWLGEWKINDKNRYMSLTIKNTDKAELEFFYDEGIGVNGISFNGIVKLVENDIAIVDYFYRGEQCKLKIQLSTKNKNKFLTLSNCELDSYDEDSKGGKTFVPQSQKLYYKAGFNCVKASTKVEFAICDSKILATSDKKLGDIYKSLRKTLSAKNKKRLRTEQRHWLKRRNKQCNKQSKNDISYCLRRYYGQRLVELNILHDYKIWHSGTPSYSMFRVMHDVKKQKKDNSSLNMMDKGLGLWLGGVMKQRITDTGSYEVQNGEFVKKSYIISGPYTSNPSEGFDPRSSGNNIFIELSADNGIWVGLVAYVNRYIYIPKNKKISSASEKFKLWMKDFEEPKIITAF